MVDRLVLLALRGVDLQLAEQRVHAERARLVGDDRHDVLAELLVAGEVAQQPGEAHRRARPPGCRSPCAARRTTLVGGQRMLRRVRAGRRLGIEPPSARRRSIMYWYSIESSDGRKYGGRSLSNAISGISSCMYSRSRSASSCSLVIFLIWCVALRPSMSGAERPALDRLAQDDRRRAGAEVLGRGLVRRVQLAVVVAAAGQVDEVLVGEVLHHRAQPRVGSEEVVADVRAVLDAVALELAVDGGVQLVEQHAVLVLGEQLVPLRAEDDLDDVPAGAAERRPRAPG